MIKLFRILFYLFVSSIVGIAIFFYVYLIACYIAPPYTKEGYGLMPVGQTFIAIILGIISGLWFFRLLLKKKIKLLP